MPHIKGASNIDWFYESEGEGENLLFLHGWGVDRRIWRQQYKFLGANFRVMAIDLPGHGQSSWEKTSLLKMTEDLNIILEKTNFCPANVVASSLGGMFALQLYAIAPEKFKRISFVGSMAKFAKSADYPYGLDIEQIRKLDGQVHTAYPSIINVFFRSLFTPEERQSRRFKWLQKFRQTEAMPMKAALSEYLDVLEKEDLREVLKTITVPMQFVFGDGDYICPLPLQLTLQQQFPKAQFVVFEKCGHFPFLIQPYGYNEVVEAFLKNGTK